MASTSSPAPAVAPKDQMATDAFLSSLAELRSMPHTHVSEKPVGRAEKPNDFGVLVTLNIPERKRKQKRFAVTGPKGDRPNLIAAAQEAKKWVNEQLTEAGIEATLPAAAPTAGSNSRGAELTRRLDRRVARSGCYHYGAGAIGFTANASKLLGR